ncbi:MAG TPA: hypothetical protein VHQ93_09100 [Chitinophagaceae bacterium]|jgi:hypothetical protein|nr:hypothetical protein [Chitinophagaceae bacterium]
MKKNLLYNVGLLQAVVFTLLITACANKKNTETVPDTLKGASPAKGDNFLKYDKISSDTTPKLHRTGLPIIRTYKGNEPLKGTYTIPGTVSVNNDSMIHFRTDQNESLTIYAEPAKEMRIPVLKESKAVLNGINNTTAAGTDEVFQLVTGDKLFLGFLWQVKEKPISFIAPAGILIQQSAIKDVPKNNSIVDSDVSVSTDNGTVKLQTGVVSTFKKGGASYTILVQTSSYQTFEDAGDGISGYILHLFIIRS